LAAPPKICTVSPAVAASPAAWIVQYGVAAVPAVALVFEQ
jgi:hypothetical protein